MSVKFDTLFFTNDSKIILPICNISYCRILMYQLVILASVAEKLATCLANINESEASTAVSSPARAGDGEVPLSAQKLLVLDAFMH